MDVPMNLYAIRDITNNEVIWNARGGAYHDIRGVSSKVKRLTKENPNNKYAVIRWSLRGSAVVKLGE